MFNSEHRIKDITLNLIKKLNSMMDSAPPKEISESFKALSNAKNTLEKNKFEHISEITNIINAVLSLSSAILKAIDESSLNESKRAIYHEAKNQRAELVNAFNSVKFALDNDFLKNIEWLISEAKRDMISISSELNTDLSKNRKLSAQMLNKINFELNQTKEKLDAIDEQSVKVIDDILKKANNFEDELISKRNRVNEILGAISDDTVRGGYSQAAREEGKTADFFRQVTLVLMFIMTSVVIVTLFQILYGEYYLTWESFLSRVFLTLVISIPTAYCAKEATRHREKHYHFKQIALDVNAIQPYLRDLPETIQNDIRKDFAMKIFINKGNEPSKDGDNVPLDVNGITNRISDAIAEKIKEKI